MMVLVTYDVETTSASGRRRLNRVARTCVNYGQRVQNSVFECVVDPALFTQFRYQLMNIIDEEKDSLRFYMMGNNWVKKVEHIGIKPGFNPETDALVV